MFDWRADNGPARVGPFPTREAALAWKAAHPGDSEWYVAPLALP